MMGHTVSKSLYWNQVSWLVLGGRTPLVSAWYVCDPVLLLLPLQSIAKLPLLQQRFMEVFSSWEVLLFILLVLGNGFLRSIDRLGLSQHFPIQHESPDAVAAFAKTFPSLSSQTDPVPGVDLVWVLVSLTGEDPAFHRFLWQRGRHCGLWRLCNSGASLGHLCLSRRGQGRSASCSFSCSLCLRNLVI